MFTLRSSTSVFTLSLVLACGSASPPAPVAATDGHGHHGADHAADHAAAAATPSAPLVAIGDAKIGDKTTCPVSGEEFIVSDKSPAIEHQGKTYYTCCGGCAKKFRANPEAFINKPAQ